MSPFHPIPVDLHDILQHCLRLWGSCLKGVSAAFPARLVCRTLVGWQGGSQGMAMSLQLGPLHLAIWAVILHPLSTEVRSPWLLRCDLFHSSPGVSFHATRQRGPTASCLHFSSEPALLGPIASPSLQTWCLQALCGPVLQKHPTVLCSPALTAWPGLSV